VPLAETESLMREKQLQETAAFWTCLAEKKVNAVPWTSFAAVVSEFDVGMVSPVIGPSVQQGSFSLLAFDHLT